MNATYQELLAKHQAREKRLGCFINFAPKPQPYVGIKPGGEREIFKAAATPTIDLYGTRYNAVIGPFRTMRGAKFMRDQWDEQSSLPACQRCRKAGEEISELTPLPASNALA